MVEKFESKMIRLGEFLRVTIPPEIDQYLNLTEHLPVTVFVNEQGNIEIEIQTNSPEASLCSICNHKKATKKCLNCGRHVCLGCFWAFGSLCKKCAKKV